MGQWIFPFFFFFLNMYIFGAEVGERASVGVHEMNGR